MIKFTATAARFVLLFSVVFVSASAVGNNGDDAPPYPWTQDACHPGEFQTELAHFLGVEQFVDRPLLKLPTIAGAGGESLVYSHAQAHVDSDRMAARMRMILSEIIRPRSISTRSDSTEDVTRIALAFGLEPRYEHLITRMAINKNAHSIVNLSVRLRHPNFADLFHIVNPSFLIVDSTTYHLHISLFEKLLMENKGLRIYSIDENTDGLPYLFEHNHDHNDERALHTPSTFPLNQEMQLWFTSGSTGLPSIVSKSFCGMVRDSRVIAQYYCTTNDTVLLTEGLDGYYTCLLYGASCVPMFLDDQNEREAEKKESLISQEVFAKMSITVMFGPPVYLDLIAEVLVDDLNMDEQRQATKSVRAIFTYGVQMPLPVQDRLVQLFSYSKITNLYGSTEAGMIGENDIKEDSLEIFKGVEVKIAHSSEEQNGEVKIRSNYMMRGYITPAGLEMPFDEDGWFSTGDVGHLDERGRLVLVGRTRPSINYGGEELDPTVVSNFWKDAMHNEGIEIEEMALVRDMNHGHSGQSAVLFCRVKQETLERQFNASSYAEVVPRTGSNIELGAISQYYSYWGTSAICFVNDFPRVGRGKINMIELEQLYAKHIKPTVISQGQQEQEQLGSFHGDSDTHMILVTLKWSFNSGSSPFEISHLEWQETEKKMLESTDEFDEL